MTPKDIKDYQKKYREKNKHKAKKYRKDHKKHIKKLIKKWMIKNPNYSKKHYLKTHPKFIKMSKKEAILKRKESNTKKRLDRKLKIIKAYGGKCSCCGESQIEFLTLDHLTKNGIKERKKFGGCKNNSGGLYNHLIKKNFPKGYQILCFNCNITKGIYGRCPHSKSKVYTH